MNKKNLWLAVLAVLLVLLLAGAYLLYQSLAAQVEPEQSIVVEEDPGTAEQAEERDLVLAPDITVYDADGNPVSLWQLQGKPVVLNFWASWCGPCKMEMPDFEAAYQNYGDQVHFMIVNLTDGSRETLETAQAYLAEQGYTFPAYFDTDGNAAMTYNTNAIPTTYFIDADGFAVAWAQGALDAERLQMGLDMILKSE